MQQKRSITLCGEHLSGPRHLCAFFDSRAEQNDTFFPYFEEGLANNERVIYILDRSRHDEVRTALAQRGIDVDGKHATQQLQILSSDETYALGGAFAASRMFEMLDDVLRKDYVRTLGEMDWALRSLPGTEELMEYECHVNTLLQTYDCTLCCSYDVSRLSGQAVMDILCTHSHVVMGGGVQENPYYMTPGGFRLSMARRPRLLPTLIRDATTSE